MTGNVTIVRHSYKVERVRKQYSVYELTETTILNNGNKINPVLTDLIRIEKDRNFHRASTNLVYWLRLRTTNNWSKCPTPTGLFKTSTPNLYYGDYIHNAKKHLLIFQFSKDEQREYLTIDYYLNYCPYVKPDRITGDLKAILLKYDNNI